MKHYTLRQVKEERRLVADRPTDRGGDLLDPVSGEGTQKVERWTSVKINSIGRVAHCCCYESNPYKTLNNLDHIFAERPYTAIRCCARVV